MQIFISHSSQDNRIVEKIVELFDIYEIDHWVDTKVLKGLGHSIDSEINRGLEASTHFLLVWSQHAKKSKWVEKEYTVTTTDDYEKRLTKIIFRLDETILPALLSSTKHQPPINEENVESITKDIIKNVLEVNTEIIDQFNYDLNEQNGQVKIGETYYDFSDVLKCVDRTEYKGLLDSWIDSEIERRKEEHYEK